MTQQPSTTNVLDALLDAMEHQIIPMTEKGVAAGNKIFGAALLRKSDFSVVLAETNNETENPLWHGEVHTLKRFYEVDGNERPDPRELIFLSTHEPCSMCLSAITWAGFDNFYYFFSHEDSRDAFAIPHDLKILKEVFTLEPGGYNRENAFWKSYAIHKLIAELPEPDRHRLQKRAAAISAKYTELSARYQAGKDKNSIPLN
ncbi:MAG: nucleoside deaminase [Phyllobacterium sp.]|jgi:tRNA(Arg) A34 adenosine deaminase TadA|uniref:nucleoside deaminase n=1 Tax=Phyllobacterium sp. TaxID=1871046 RepID=UPI0030F20F36